MIGYHLQIYNWYEDCQIYWSLYFNPIGHQRRKEL
jgi:hypothetical protein